MRKVLKNIISFGVVLIIGTIGVTAYADPFGGAVVAGMEAMGVGIGVTGSAAGFGTFVTGPTSSDPLGDWTDPLGDYQLYYKHDAVTVEEEGQTVSYDMVWFSQDFASEIQSKGIAFINNYGISDNSSGTLMSGTGHIDGIPVFYNSNPPTASQTYTTQFYFIPALGDYNIGNAVIHATSGYSGWKMSVTWSNGTTVADSSYNGRNGFYVFTSGQQFPSQLRSYTSPTYGSYYSVCNCPTSLLDNNPFSFDYVSAIVDLTPTNKGLKLFVKSGNIQNVIDGWYNYNDSTQHTDMLAVVSGITEGAGHDEIKDAEWTDDYDPPVPPQPIPDTPLGDVPFDDWVDLWGQSIWDQLTRLEEKQELMVIGQETGLESLEDLQGIGEDLLEDVDDLIGLETDINENLEDMIIYEQGISEDVEDINENVEDIEDEVIVIVDEMGNVIDVLEGIDAKLYAQGQQLGSISTEVGTAADATEAIQTEVEAQTEIQEDIKEAVEDMVPYVAPLPDIATDTETIVDILPDIATSTETSTQTLTDTLPDIKDATQTITDTLPDIITEIQDATTTLTDDIPNIDDICENIDEAPYKDIDTGLDHLPRFMLPFITDLRSALGIWHYVTEWLAQISTTFAFISGCLVGTSIMTPIYAAIAGFMCIKVYRRMTS